MWVIVVEWFIGISDSFPTVYTHLNDAGSHKTGSEHGEVLDGFRRRAELILLALRPSVEETHQGLGLVSRAQFPEAF